jgi:outer membrane lipoprotein carrier protein
MPMRTFLFSMLWMSFSAHAAGIDALKTFINGTESAQARFAQMVLDRNMKKLQQASGTMQFSRPGKFRWVYDKPYEQVIVGDGKQLWIYDKDLNQVTVRQLDRALGSSPAALLAGKGVLEENYTLSNIGNQEDLEWVEAIPKTQDTAFERVRIGFGKSGLEAMELRDQFGQITVIKFADLERNPKLPPDTFQFTPPAGADIIRE